MSQELKNSLNVLQNSHSKHAHLPFCIHPLVPGICESSSDVTKRNIEGWSLLPSCLFIAIPIVLATTATALLPNSNNGCWLVNFPITQLLWEQRSLIKSKRTVQPRFISGRGRNIAGGSCPNQTLQEILARASVTLFSFFRNIYFWLPFSFPFQFPFHFGLWFKTAFVRINELLQFTGNTNYIRIFLRWSCYLQKKKKKITKRRISGLV